MFNINGHASERHVKGRASGIGIIQYVDGGREIQHDTVRCVHCGYTWVYEPGSGRTRGWCGRCQGITCARPCCENRGCIPMERELEFLEKLIDWNQMTSDMIPVSVSMPANVSPKGIILG